MAVISLLLRSIDRLVRRIDILSEKIFVEKKVSTEAGVFLVSYENIRIKKKKWLLSFLSPSLHLFLSQYHKRRKKAFFICPKLPCLSA